MDMFDMEENGGIVILQIIVIVLAMIIMYMLYSDRSATIAIEEKVNNFKCPQCPEIPECPACNCSEGETSCPDCICDRESMECPPCPECPKSDVPNVDDIVNAIFPGRNQGVTAYGEYYPLGGLDETTVEPAYSPSINMIDGAGTPSSVNFQDEMLMNESSSMGIASEVDPPIDSGAGVFSEPSQVAPPGGVAGAPEETDATDTDAAASTNTDVDTQEGFINFLF